MTTDSTLFRCLLKSRIEVILFTVHFSMDIVKGFSSQSTTTTTTDETVGVINISHCLTCLISTLNPLSTCITNAKVITTRRLFHLIFYFFHHLFNLLLCFGWSLWSGRCYRKGKQ